MVNHVRTLLLNLPQRVGEEYIPSTYVPPALPQLLRDAARALFGSPASRDQRVVRVDRFLTYAHASTLAPDLLLSDARLTYDPVSPAATADPTIDQPPHAFAVETARTDLDGVFAPAASEAEARWFDVWTSAAPAPDRAVALGLALAARTAELAGVT